MKLTQEKHMKHLLNVTILTGILALTATQAQAGGRDGGGGGALVCPPGHKENVVVDGKEYQAQLLELWEARHRGGLFAGLEDIKRNGQSVNSQMLEASKKLEALNPKLGDLVSERVKRFDFIQKTDVSQKGQEIIPPTDHRLRSIPVGCSIKGVGSYSDVEDNLEYDKKLLESMHLTDQAAFWLHEIVYRQFRIYERSEDSTQTRVLVARLFSDNNLKSPSYIQPEATLAFVCEGRKEPGIVPSIMGSVGRFYLSTDSERTVWINIENRAAYYNPKLGFVALMSTFNDPIIVRDDSINGRVLGVAYANAIDTLIATNNPPIRQKGMGYCVVFFSGVPTGFFTDVCGEQKDTHGAMGSSSNASRTRSSNIIPYIRIHDNRPLLPTNEPGVYKFNGHIGVNLNGEDIDGESKVSEDFYCRQREI